MSVCPVARCTMCYSPTRSNIAPTRPAFVSALLSESHSLLLLLLCSGFWFIVQIVQSMNWRTHTVFEICSRWIIIDAWSTVDMADCQHIDNTTWCLCFFLSVTHNRESLSPRKTDQPIEMLFGVWDVAWGGPKEPCIRWGNGPPQGKGQFWGTCSGLLIEIENIWREPKLFKVIH